MFSILHNFFKNSKYLSILENLYPMVIALIFLSQFLIIDEEELIAFCFIILLIFVILFFSEFFTIWTNQRIFILLESFRRLDFINYLIFQRYISFLKLSFGASYLFSQTSLIINRKNNLMLFKNNLKKIIYLKFKLSVILVYSLFCYFVWFLMFKYFLNKMFIEIGIVNNQIDNLFLDSLIFSLITVLSLTNVDIKNILNNYNFDNHIELFNFIGYLFINNLDDFLKNEIYNSIYIENIFISGSDQNLNSLFLLIMDSQKN